MSNHLVHPDQPSTQAVAPGVTDVKRTPFYCESQGRWLFAWLHQGELAPRSDQGVILCPPIGHEQVHAHRGLRHLADELARAGFLVVRFDYQGTGDSSGSCEAPDQVAAWLANVRDVHGWLQRHLGCPHIHLVGLRLGAALATLAAADHAVESVLLWVPVDKGRSYVRELKALGLSPGGGPKPSLASERGVEVCGFLFTEQTVQALSHVDLLQSQPRCRRCLIVTRDDLPGDSRLLEHFRGLGIETQQAALPGYVDMMTEPHYNKVPRQAIDHMVAWLRTGYLKGDRSPERFHSLPSELIGASSPSAAENRAFTPPRSPLPPKRNGTEEANRHDPGPAGRIAHYPQSAEVMVQAQQWIRERAIVISQQPQLFGIVSEPWRPVPHDSPIIVMVNAGSAYRVGPNRLYVSLVRQFAAQGFRCLRMDLCGLGDSVAADPERENNPYPATAFRDVDLTLKYLQTQLGAERVLLMGLCSGAYVAFQAAVQLANPVLVESILINPHTFYWREGMSLEASPALQLMSFRDCMNSVWQPGKWLKFLSGRSKLGFSGATRMLIKRWRLRHELGYNASAANHAAFSDAAATHPLQEDLPGDLDRIVKAGRHLACFFARDDPGYDILTLNARHKVNALLRAGKMSLHFLDHTDHTFSRRAARAALRQVLSEHLSQRYLPAGS